MPSELNKVILENSELIQNCYINEISRDDSEYFSLVTNPFKVLKLRNVISCGNFKKELFSAVQSISLKRKDNDLYSLWQTDDLNNCGLKPIKRFINFLQKEIAPFLSTALNIQLNEKLSITVSKYEFTDVLLCHDDKCEDRCIAFVYYLTGKEGAGGTFDMFNRDENDQPKDVAYSIPPEENSLVVFEVGNTTYHQVSEVSDLTFQRWSINGWFHSDRTIPLLSYEEPVVSLQKQKPVQNILILDKLLTEVYCTRLTISQMVEEFECNSFLLLKDFLTKELFDGCSKEFPSDSLIWKKVGPANRRNYFSASLCDLPFSINALVEFLSSPGFINYLSKLTSLSLEAYKGEEDQGSEFSLEVIKWTGGCYTMATDNDSFFKRPGLDLFLFFSCAGVLSSCPAVGTSGYVTYLDTGGDEEGNEEEGMEADEEEEEEEKGVDGETDDKKAVEKVPEEGAGGDEQQVPDEGAAGGEGSSSGVAPHRPFQPDSPSSDSVSDNASDAQDKELLTIVPEENALALVYRTDHTVRFTKYINHSVPRPYYAIYATYYESTSG